MENYYLINEQTNVCDNICVWDGNTEVWSPPDGILPLPQLTTPTKDWEWIDNQWQLVESIGNGSIGFVWDGVYLITNQPQPDPPVPTEE
jgi:hypothetical protein